MNAPVTEKKNAPVTEKKKVLRYFPAMLLTNLHFEMEIYLPIHAV